MVSGTMCLERYKECWLPVTAGAGGLAHCLLRKDPMSKLRGGCRVLEVARFMGGLDLEPHCTRGGMEAERHIYGVILTRWSDIKHMVDVNGELYYPVASPAGCLQGGTPYKSPFDSYFESQCNTCNIHCGSHCGSHCITCCPLFALALAANVLDLAPPLLPRSASQEPLITTIREPCNGPVSVPSNAGIRGTLPIIQATTHSDLDAVPTFSRRPVFVHRIYSTASVIFTHHTQLTVV
jgi:hypothetical protein